MAVMAQPNKKKFIHNFSISIHYDCIRSLEATKSKQKHIKHDWQTLLSGLRAKLENEFRKKRKNETLGFSASIKHTLHYTWWQCGNIFLMIKNPIMDAIRQNTQSHNHLKFLKGASTLPQQQEPKHRWKPTTSISEFRFEFECITPFITTNDFETFCAQQNGL